MYYLVSVCARQNRASLGTRNNDLEHVLTAAYETEILLILKRHRRTVSQQSDTVQLDMHNKHFQVVIIALSCR